jgi:chitin synthase
MFIYILSLPIWNLVLPVYAFWKFDDFSWGETRKVEGEAKGAGHGDDEGEFDSSKIVMRRWEEFERERRSRLPVQAWAPGPGSQPNVGSWGHVNKGEGGYEDGFSDY